MIFIEQNFGRRSTTNAPRYVYALGFSTGPPLSIQSLNAPRL
jgi:hypothetical protein